MTTSSLRPMAFRFALGSVLGAALLAGTAYGDARASAAREDAAALDRADAKAVERAEEAVAKSPHDATLRTALGQVYLRAGRFESARAAFTDAMALGGSDGRTALGLALANIARGNNREAIGILEAAAGGIPAGDLGLALALAGDTRRGVAVLYDTLRGGEDTPKLRQNLAYAYALDGRWAESRMMMMQDVPAEQISARLTQWAASGRPDLAQHRVAALLGAPLRGDPGQPTHLALSAPAPKTQAAEAEAPAPVYDPAQAYAPIQNYAPEPAVMAELPPAESDAYTPQPATYAPMPAPLAAYSASAEVPLAAPQPAPREDSLAAFEEFAQPSMLAVAPAPAAAARAPARTSAPSTAARPVDGGNHVVQLGAFASEQNARRAWDRFVARNSELRNARMVITPALVNGRNFWRVAAASYDRSAAADLCSSVKARGGACFAYATSGPRQNLLMARTSLRPGGGPTFARR
jgi:Flp pilus assembly protein TadD